MTDRSEAEVAAALEAYEKAGVVLGYPALIDWDQTDKEYVQAIIELKVTPERDTRYNKFFLFANCQWPHHEYAMALQNPAVQR